MGCTLRQTKPKVQPEEAEQIYNYWLQTVDEFLAAFIAAAEDADTAI